uniref:U5 small nuclear ribonucleoprotein helicase n=1 Tax=Tanacetum cinerariifolium TaxID=118510 RepID=A0A699HYJ8_TANCI|nr:U5 small nuclear ribonucleoprotein helicase [Tanacetum cinerariifolium]
MGTINVGENKLDAACGIENRPNGGDANSTQQNKGSISKEAGSLKGENVRADHYDDTVTPCAHTELGPEHKVSRNIKGCGDTTRKGAVAGTSAGVSQLKEGSFASLLRPNTVINKLHFRTLVNEEKVESSDCVLPKDAANLVKCREDIPKASSMAAKSNNIEENEKGDGGKSSPSRVKHALNTLVSNPFEMLNMVREDACDSSAQQPKGSDHGGISSSNLDKKEAQEEGLWSCFKKAKENSKCKVSELKDEYDEDEVYMPYGGGGIDGLEDDLDCYDGYGTQVYDLTPQEQAYCDQYDIRLNGLPFLCSGWKKRHLSSV